mgnify:CR=1 FL=1
MSGVNSLPSSSTAFAPAIAKLVPVGKGAVKCDEGVKAKPKPPKKSKASAPDLDDFDDDDLPF